MNNNTIYQVDSFTDEIFKGNPAGVMILDQMPSDIFMQNMAMEMNLSETAFVVPENDIFRIRFFTPKAEIPVAGHPTLASAHILYELGIVPASKEITFEASVATLHVKREQDLIVMTFPEFSLKQIEVHPEFESTVGFEPIEMYTSDYKWKIAVANSLESIKSAQPLFAKMPKIGLGHLMITAPNDSDKSDFVVRCFAPDLGVNEDPVTGSAHCALTPLWAKKLKKTSLTSLQLSVRSGKLFLEHHNDTVIIKGKAVTVFEGELRNGVV